ncbi:MAG: polysaccharide biosynthesis tyrosine autokinase [Gammaproteobacteria bacterium]|nr:polysaccharide biosynthesis tyrosine autokinase [Gammaproteobacteria bacterium]
MEDSYFQNQNNIRDDEVKLTEVFSHLWRYRIWMLSVVVFFVVAAVLYLSLAVPIFKSEAMLRIENDKSALSVLSDMEMLGDMAAAKSSEHEIIRSRRVLGEVVDELSLTLSVTAEAPLFIGAAIHNNSSFSIFNSILSDKYVRYAESIRLSAFSIPHNQLGKSFVLRVKADSAGYDLFDENGGLILSGKTGQVNSQHGIELKVDELTSHLNAEYVIRKHSRQTVIGNLYEKLKVNYSDRRSKEILRISFEHADAELAAKVVNSVSRHYINYNIKTQTAVAEKTLLFIEDQLSKFSGDMVFSNEIYKMLIKKANQLKVLKAGEIGGVSVVDWGVPAERPVKPNKSLVFMASLIAGLFLGAVLALVRAFMDQKIYDPNAIEYSLNLPVYATVPLSQAQVKLNRQALKLTTNSVEKLGVLYRSQPDDPAIESMRFLRTNLEGGELKLKHRGVIVITGPTPNAGKSFMSVNLACLYAELGQKVLLVDADVRKGVQHRFFDCNNKNGLSEYLSGNLEFSDVVKSTDMAGLDVITSGKCPNNSSVLMSSYKLKNLFEIAKTQYDVILVDTPPVLSITDATIVAKHSDRLMVVVRSGLTTMDEVSICWRKLTQSGKKPTGLVMSGYAPGRLGYGKYSQYAAY